MPLNRCHPPNPSQSHSHWVSPSVRYSWACIRKVLVQLATKRTNRMARLAITKDNSRHHHVMAMLAFRMTLGTHHGIKCLTISKRHHIRRFLSTGKAPGRTLGHHPAPPVSPSNQGLITSKPAARKGLVSRVATMNPLARATAAMQASAVSIPPPALRTRTISSA